MATKKRSDGQPGEPDKWDAFFNQLVTGGTTPQAPAPKNTGAFAKPEEGSAPSAPSTAPPPLPPLSSGMPSYAAPGAATTPGYQDHQYDLGFYEKKDPRERPGYFDTGNYGKEGFNGGPDQDPNLHVSMKYAWAKRSQWDQFQREKPINPGVAATTAINEQVQDGAKKLKPASAVLGGSGFGLDDEENQSKRASVLLES